MTHYLKPASFVRLFFSNCTDLGLVPQEQESAAIKNLKRAIIVIISIAALPFYALGGVFYNASAIAIKGSVFLYYKFIKDEKDSFNAKDYKKILIDHLWMGGIDLIGNFLPLPFSIIFIIFPFFSLNSFNQFFPQSPSPQPVFSPPSSSSSHPPPPPPGNIPPPPQPFPYPYLWPSFPVYPVPSFSPGIAK